jgi:polysaccharide export outer membrane protein
MSVRGFVLCVAVMVSLAGCAKTNRDFAATDPSLTPHGDQAADDKSLHPPGDEGPLPSDPIAKAPPMPVAVLEAIKKLNEPGHGGAVAFLEPSVARVSREPTDIGPAPSMTQPYLLDSGDKVRVFVYGQPNLSHVYPIDGAGFISVPLIGNVRARGLTTYHLGEQIAAQLKVSFVKDPQISVEMAETRPFYILGEVRAAGRYPFEPGLTVEAAVAIAGGFGARASEREVRLTRRINGDLNELHVPLTEAVRPGDTIHVEERWF